MINFVFIKNTVINILKNPGVFTLISLLIFILFLFLIKFDMDHTQGNIEYIEFFIKIEHYEIDSTGKEVLRNISGIFNLAILFLLILQSSTVFPELINGSMIKLILSRGFERREVFLLTFWSELIAILIILLLFGIGLTFIILIKSKGYITIIPIYFSVIIFFVFTALFSFIVPVSLLTKNSLFTTIIAILCFYFLLPFLHLGFLSYVEYFKYVFPPILFEQNLFFKESIELLITVIVSLVYVYFYAKLSDYIFTKMEIN